MNVNVSHRLLKQKIEQGYNFYWSSAHDFPKATYALKNYNEGDIIRKLEGKIVDTPTRESIHIGDNKHVIDAFGSFINHSFEPNTKIVGNNVIAIKDINQYEEITFNYNDSEINMACPFEVDNIKVCGK